MQIAPTLRNILADAIDTDIGATGFARFYDSGFANLLADIALNNPAFDAAASGVIALNVTPAVEDTSPAFAGTAVRLGLYQNNTDASGLWRVLFGIATSGTPDITMSNNVIAVTDTIQIQSLTLTVPSGTPDVT